MKDRIILSIGDYSGGWSQPYRDAGYQVMQVDPKLKMNSIDGYYGGTVQRFIRSAWFEGNRERVHGILMAPPCTDFAASGAQYWRDKDRDGRTAGSLAIVYACLELRDLCPNLQWWALENPVGRLHKLVPLLGRPLYVQPYQFAGLADDPERDRYTKKTGLWGVFNQALPMAPMDPIKVCTQGSWLQKLGGKSERTKALRSMTPQGLARAFFAANP